MPAHLQQLFSPPVGPLFCIRNSPFLYFVSLSDRPEFGKNPALVRKLSLCFAHSSQPLIQRPERCCCPQFLAYSSPRQQQHLRHQDPLQLLAIPFLVSDSQLTLFQILTCTVTLDYGASVRRAPADASVCMISVSCVVGSDARRRRRRRSLSAVCPAAQAVPHRESRGHEYTVSAASSLTVWSGIWS